MSKRIDSFHGYIENNIFDRLLEDIPTRPATSFDIIISKSTYTKGKITIKITFNGYQWNAMDFSPKEFAILQEKINQYKRPKTRKISTNNKTTT